MGDYDVTVVSVDLEATDEILAENEFNEPPTNDDYALVTVRATYVGEDEGTPSSDLSVTLDGGDGVQYEQFECSAVTPNGTDFTTLTNGGATTYDLCWDYRTEAGEGPRCSSSRSSPATRTGPTGPSTDGRRGPPCGRGGHPSGHPVPAPPDRTDRPRSVPM